MNKAQLAAEPEILKQARADQKAFYAKLKATREWYSIRSLMGCTNWAMFYILLGAREVGKSWAVAKLFAHDWITKHIPFTWLRLNEASTKKMLANNGEKLFDPGIRRMYNLEEITTRGTNVYENKKLMGRVLALSTFANDKGVAYFDNEFLNDPLMHFNICLDEFELEKGQKRQGDISYQFIGQLENLLRSTKERVRVFLIGNTLEEAADILTLFNFVPEKFGRYYLKSKRCVIDYEAPNEAYKARRKGSAADLLGGDLSNYTNEIDFDMSRIWKGRPLKPSYVIRFDMPCKSWFTCWDGRLIKPYNGEQISTHIAMIPYLGIIFDAKLRDSVFQTYDARGYLFPNILTQKLFQRQLKILKPRGSNL